MSDTAAHTHHLRVLTSTLLVLVASVVAFNLVIDPYDIYWGFTALGDYKQEHRSRIAKAEMLSRAGCETVILGTSRAEAVNPRSKEFKGDGRVCNGALVGANTVEMNHVYRWVQSTAPLKRLLLFTAFIQYSDTRTVIADFTNSRFNTDRDRIDYTLDTVVGLRTVLASTSVLNRYSRNEPSHWKILGNRRGIPNMRPTRAMFRAGIKGYLLKPEGYSTYRYDPGRIEVLGKIIRDARAAGVQVDVAIAPVHVLQLEILRTAGLQPTYERWKRELVAEVHAASDGELPVWDFTGYDPHTTERLPREGKVDGMRWFWESSHAKRELADVVVRRIRGRDAPASFGAPLTPDTVESVLLRHAEEREAWLAGNEADHRFVREVAAKALADKARGARLPLPSGGHRGPGLDGW